MDDKELLELAARAYWGDEINDVCSIRWSDEDQTIAYTHGENQDHNGHDRELLWLPLTDDGDALRLAVKLEIDIRQKADGCHVEYGTGWCLAGLSERDDSDHYAATRRAIVRAAAEIGKGVVTPNT